jgi:selenium-binding protein 1
MPLSKLALGLIWAVVASGAPPNKRQYSLPPLIPYIPGVTEVITENAPPLPILQLPTPGQYLLSTYLKILADAEIPALSSPPYNGSDIRPTKIGYFWTGAGDNHHSDFLASYSLDDDTFGTLLRVVDVNSAGNSPHHLGASRDGKILWGGGLLSLLKTQGMARLLHQFKNQHPH